MKLFYYVAMATLVLPVFTGCDNARNTKAYAPTPEDRFAREADSIERLLPSLKDDSTKINVLYKLASHYASQDIEKAKKYSQEGIDLAIKIAPYYGDYGPRFISGMYQCMGICLAEDGNVKSAISYFILAEKEAKYILNKFPSSYLTAQINLAQMYNVSQKFDSSIHIFKNVIEVAYKYKEYPRIVMAYTSIGDINKSLGNHKKSILYYMKADSISREHNVSVSGVLWVNWGTLLVDMKKYKEAIEMYKKSKNVRNLNIKYSSIKSISHAFLELNSIDSARFYQKSALEIAKTLKSKSKIYGAYRLGIAIDLREDSLAGIAIPVALLAQVDSLKEEKEGQFGLRRAAYNLKIHAAKQRGDVRALSAAYDSIISINREQYDQTTAQTVADTETRLRVHEQQTAAAAALHRKELQLWITGLVAILLLAVVAVFLLLNRRLQRQKATIVAQSTTLEDAFHKIEQSQATITAQAKRLEILNKSISHNAKNDLNQLQLLAVRAVNSGHPDDLEDVLRYIQTVTAVRRLTDAKGDTPEQLDPTYLIPALLRIHPRPVRTHLDLDEVPLLPEQQGLWLAQLLNEWLTNAHKHAFKQHPDPELHLSCWLSDGQYEVIFADNGPGLPADAAPRGDHQRGLGLIQDYVHLLSGVLTTDSSPDGLRYTLRFPVV